MGDNVNGIKMRFAENAKECLIAISESNRTLVEFLKNCNASSFAIICDSNTQRLFGNKLKGKLSGERLKAELFSFPAGEKSKRLKTVESIMEKMLDKGVDRKSMVVALGGGVVGDIAGFVASAYMRGIAYVQVPTT